MTEEMSTPEDASVVLQVSRWDGLKDPIGVMTGFVEAPELTDAHLILLGPAPSSVADDPEAGRVLGEVRTRWADLRGHDRERVHLANVPTEDVEEAAVVVNAMQRRADVVVQKSLAEGFGLTVTEAMWKARPVVAGSVGGIRDQIEHGVSGILVDPRDLILFGGAVAGVLGDPSRAAALGAAARRSVVSRYLPTHYLGGYLDLFLRLTSESGPAGRSR
jgi:trehalose synthase